MPMNRSSQHARFLELWPTWEGDRKTLAVRLGVSVRTVSQWVRTPILFLDVDGVLNSHDQLAESKRLRGMAPKHVAELARILRETGANVVVSSAWRFEVGDDGSTRVTTRFGGELAEKGEDGALIRSRIIGRTKDLWKDWFDRECLRGHEILTWLREHGHTGPFVILDDDADMGPVMQHLVQTDFATGLTREVADEVIRRLSA